MFLFRNPPGRFIEGIAQKITEFTLRLAASCPLLRVMEATQESLGANLYRVRTVVKNVGFLPTYLTFAGRDAGEITGATVEIVCGEDAEVVMNEVCQDLGHLEGWSQRRQPWSGWGLQWGPTARTVEWLVRARSPGARVCIRAHSAKGGTHSMTLTLGRDLREPTNLGPWPPPPGHSPASSRPGCSAGSHAATGAGSPRKRTLGQAPL